MPPLAFVEETARDLHRELVVAGWRPAGNGAGLLLNPSTDLFYDTLSEAFAVAHSLGATFLFSFIGHGVATGEHDFYLMAKDSPYEDPTRFLDSRSAIDFTHFLKERMNQFKRIDGFVVLADACQAQEGIEGAAERWTRKLAENRGRMELLVASGKAAAHGNAYEGCFTKTILKTFASGLPKRGDALLLGDLQPEIGANCVAQSQYLAYSGGSLSSGDPGLWLVPNIARSRDAVTRRPAAGLVDQLTSNVIATDSVRDHLLAIDEARAARLRLLFGVAGSGKSTLLALMIRPKLIDTLELPEGYVKAAVFLDTRSTVETMAMEMAAQLTVTMPDFPAATERVAAELTQEDIKERGLWETSVMMPLARLKRPGLHIPVIVDGLDQPEVGARELIIAALEQLTHIAPQSELGHVRVIAGVRSDTGINIRKELIHAHPISIKPPALAEIAQAATSEFGIPLTEADFGRLMGGLTTGGWLIARLVREIAYLIPDAKAFVNLSQLTVTRARLALGREPTGPPTQILSLIAAGGVGPLLPIRLIVAALGNPDTLLDLVRVRDAVVELGALNHPEFHAPSGFCEPAGRSVTCWK